MKATQPTTFDPLVITGIGVISVVGFGTDALLPLMTLFSSGKPLPTRISRSIDLSETFVSQRLGKKGLRLLDKPTLLALLTAQAALDDSRINLDSANKNRVAVSVGTAMGVADSRYDFYQAALLRGPSAANPAKFPFTIGNAIASQIALRFQLKGINSSISAGCASGFAALDWAATQVYSGRVDTVLLTAAEALSDPLFSRLEHIPEIASASLADGSVSLVLEKQSTAISRGQKIYAQVGESCCRSYWKETFSADNYLADIVDSTITYLKRDDEAPRKATFSNASDIGIEFCENPARIYCNRYFYEQLNHGMDKRAKVKVMDTTPIAGDTVSASGLMQIVHAMIDNDPSREDTSENHDSEGKTKTKLCYVVCSCPTGYVGHTSLITNYNHCL